LSNIFVSLTCRIFPLYLKIVAAHCKAMSNIYFTDAAKLYR